MKRTALIILCLALCIMTFASPARASIVEGQVKIQGTSTPIAGALVRAYYVFGWEGMPDPTNYEQYDFVEATTGADGTYMVDVPEGSFFIMVAGAPSYLAEFFQEQTNPLSATPMPSGFDQISNINFTLEPGGWVSGRVTDIAGNPLAGISIYVESVASGQVAALAVTGPTGTYGTSGLATGAYRVRASGYGTPYLGKVYNNGNAVNVVSGAATPNINFALELGGSITGVVVDSSGRPVTGAWVGAMGTTAGGQQITTSAADGSYTLGGLVTDNYIVGAQRDGLVTTFYFNAYTQDQAIPVGVTKGAVTSGIDLVMDTMGTISGIVTEQGTGTPIAGATVIAYSLADGQSGQTATGADGSYTVEGLMNGTFVVYAEHATHSPVYYNGVPDAISATPVDVMFGSNTPNINMAMARMGSISGMVVEDATGNPIEKAMVTVLNAASGTAVWSSVTGTDGTYRVEGLDTGTYRLMVSHEQYITEYYNNADTFEAGTDISVILGVDSPGHTVSLARRPFISGRVTNGQGTPIAGISVVAASVPPASIVSAQTDQNGYYTITGVAPGNYNVSTGNDIYARTYYNNAPDASSATLVTVSTTTIPTNINFVLALGGSISGTISLENGVWDMSETMVSVLTSSTGMVVATALCDMNGNYLVAGLPAGSYKVYSETVTFGYMSGYFPQGQDLALATAVNVTAGATTANINFMLRASFFIDGYVRDDGGQPISGILVTVTTNSYSRSVRTNELGYYWISPVPDGVYKIFFDATGTPFASMYYMQAYTLADAAPVWPSADQGAPYYDVQLTRLTSISGTVRDGANGIGGIWVRAENAQDPQIHGSAQTGADGTYAIAGLLAGNYIVRADAAGTSYLSSTYPGVLDVSIDRSGIDFALLLGGSVSGTVVSAETGSVLSGVTVGVYDITRGKPTLLSSATTSVDGSYQVNGIQPGSQMVMAEAPDLMRVRQVYQGAVDARDQTGVTVVSGNTTTNINFSLQQGGAVAGTVYDPNGAPLVGARVRAVLADGSEVVSSATFTGGLYQLNGVPVGGSNYIVVHPDGTPYVGQFYGGEIYRERSLPVSVATGTVTPGIDFGLQAGALLSGTILTDWSPASIAGIDLWRENDLRWLTDSAIEAVITDPVNGTWSVAVPSGSYKVLAQARRDGTTYYENQYYADWGGRPYQFNVAGLVVAGAGNFYGGFDFYLNSIGGQIRGTTSYGGTKTGKVITRASNFGITQEEGLKGFVKYRLGTYALPVVAEGQYIDAFMDVNGNNVYDAGEPYGMYAGGSGNFVMGPYQSEVAGIDIVLQDPVRKVTLVDYGNTLFTPSTGPTVTYGDTVSFTIRDLPAGTYPGVSGCDGTLVNNIYTTGPMTADCFVYGVVYIGNPDLRIEPRGNGAGSISVANYGPCDGGCNPPVNLNDTVTITATPDQWSTFTGWVGACSGTGDCLVTMDGSKTVAALFTRTSYTVTPGVVTNGSIRPSTPQTVEYGGTRNFVIIPHAGYQINGVSGCSGSLNGLVFTLDPVYGDCSLTPTVSQIPYTVYVSVIEGQEFGMISPWDQQTALYGDQIPFDVTFNAGYHALVTGCSGTLVGSTYTTGPITGNCTITARFFNTAPIAPALVSPPDAQEVTMITRRPTLEALSMDADGDPLTYTFEVSFEPGFQYIVARGTVTAREDGYGQWTVNATLHDNTLYYWRSYAEDGAARSPDMSTASFFMNTVNDPPMRPTAIAPIGGIQVTSATPTFSVFKAGDLDRDLLSYEFEVSLSSTLTGSVFVSPADSGLVSSTPFDTVISWNSTSLIENTVYYWHARAIDEHGAGGPWSVINSFYVNADNQQPGMPALASPAAGSETANTTPVLTVTNATDPEGSALTYYFEIDSVNTFDSADKQSSGQVFEGSGATSWTPAALNDNTVWYWRVKANDGSADSSWMSTASFFVNTANDAPGTPSVNYPGDRVWVTTLRPQLSLNAATDVDRDVLTYEYEVYSDKDLFSIVKSATDKGTSWTVDGPLSDNTWYFWRSRARDEHGLAGPWTTVTTFFVNNSGYNDPPSITITAPGENTTISPNTVVMIRWVDSDPDSNAMITLGYDTTGIGCNGTTIETGISENDPGNNYAWNTGNLTPGTYYLYAKIDDGTTAVCSYAGSSVTSTLHNGDISADGKIDLSDVLAAMRVVLGQEVLTPWMLSHGDIAPVVNGVSQPDGVIDINDVLAILRKVIGLW